MSNKKINKGTRKHTSKPREKTRKNKCPVYHPYVKFEEDYSGRLDPKNLIKTNLKSKLDYVKKLKIEFAPSDITPQNDFYSYVNYKWVTDIRESEIINQEQKYITEIDAYRLLQDKVYTDINLTIDDYLKNNKSRLATNVRHFSNSAEHSSTIKEGRRHIKNFILYLDEMRKDKKNIWKLLAYLNKLEMIKVKCPFVWNLVADKKNSKKFITDISPHRFELLQTEGFMTPDEYAKGLVYHKFDKNLKRLFSVCVNDPTTDYTTVIPVLKDMLAAFEHFDIPEEDNEYAPLTLTEADEKFGFNAREFLIEMGYKELPTHINFPSLNYLKYTTKLMLDNWDSDKWRNYWIWIYAIQVCRTTRNWSDIYFDYYGKILRGQQVEASNTIKRAVFTEIAFNKLISYEYIDRFVDPNLVDTVKNLSADLKIVFKKMITRCKWMMPKTRKLALEKLDALKFIFVRPEVMADDPPVTIEYSNTDLWGNLLKYSNWRTKYLVDLINKPVQPFPIVDWSEYPFRFASYQPFIVNAEYIPSINSIYIPAAIIQQPFVDLGRSITYNLATMGFIIAHELSHSLDDVGSKYDKNGNFNSWWTPHDKREFKKIQSDILRQYREWMKRDGIDFDPEDSIGEDIADISAISICGDFLKDYMRTHDYAYPNQLLNFRLFYNHFALHIRQKINKVSLRSQLIANPHPPDKYRCNIPLSRSVVFRAVYNIKRGDKMWWHSLNQIW